MPLDWSGALDLFGQIWCWLGFLVGVLLLQWLELRARKRGTASFNKARLVAISPCATEVLLFFFWPTVVARGRG